MSTSDETHMMNNMQVLGRLAWPYPLQLAVSVRAADWQLTAGDGQDRAVAVGLRLRAKVALSQHTDFTTLHPGGQAQCLPIHSMRRAQSTKHYCGVEKQLLIYRGKGGRA